MEFVTYLLYVNSTLVGAIFVWMLRIERHVAEIKTTCKLKGGCGTNGSDTGA